jgi:hypothetical protein
MQQKTVYTRGCGGNRRKRQANRAIKTTRATRALTPSPESYSSCCLWLARVSRVTRARGCRAQRGTGDLGVCNNLPPFFFQVLKHGDEACPSLPEPASGSRTLEACLEPWYSDSCAQGTLDHTSPSWDLHFPSRMWGSQEFLGGDNIRFTGQTRSDNTFLSGFCRSAP